MSVYVITHKKFNMIPQENYKVLLVGAYRGHVYGDCFDDAGDNISEKNANYCELTGVYWLWKNLILFYRLNRRWSRTCWSSSARFPV